MKAYLVWLNWLYLVDPLECYVQSLSNLKNHLTKKRVDTQSKESTTVSVLTGGKKRRHIRPIWAVTVQIDMRYCCGSCCFLCTVYPNLYINSAEKKTRTGFDIFLLLLLFGLWYFYLCCYCCNTIHNFTVRSTFLVTWSVTFNNPKIEWEVGVPDTLKTKMSSVKIIFQGKGDFSISI